MNYKTLFLRLLGVLGAVLFTTFFTFTYSVPGWVEEVAAEYIEAEARKYVDTTIDSAQLPASDSALGRLAQSLHERNEARIEQMKSDLKNRVYEKWADAIAQVRDLDCECRQKWEDWLEGGLIANIASLDSANQQVSRLIHANYMDVATELKKDIRIFTGGNAAVFILLLLISFVKPRAMTHLFLPGLLLVISTVICSYFYLFEQNWLFTIIHNSYVGFAYLAWLGVVFGFLLDIVLNSARVTSSVINAIAEAIGLAISVVPC